MSVPLLKSEQRLVFVPAPATARPIATCLLYYPGVRCPTCGGRSFHIRTITAECASCEAALIVSNPSEEVLFHG